MPGNFRRTSMLTAVLMVLAAPITYAATGSNVAELVIDRNFPDPDVLETGGQYYAFATNTAGYHVQAATASTPDGSWQQLPDALPELPGWIGYGSNGSLNIWAPDVSERADGTFLLYYTAFHAGNGKQCVGAAVSANPAGPFTPTGPDPLICARAQGDIIDPASFVDSDGSRYLLYKDSRGPRARSGPSSIWIRPVAADGLTPTGHDVSILHADRPEEAGVVEAPTLVRRPGGYVLLFSGNTFDSGSYFTNYATASRITGPYTKAPGALLSADALGGSVVDPGGQDVTADGEHILFHGDLAEPGGDRGLYAADLSWNGSEPALAPDIRH
ncbi:glycoside hydrolase family 43 protein [Parasphingorhabdus pacifica]